jgi:hypothetical protein
MRRASVAARGSWRGASLLQSGGSAELPYWRPLSPACSTIQVRPAGWKTTWRRFYGRKPARQPRAVSPDDKAQAATSSHLGDNVAFAADDLPPLSFWEEMAALGPEDLSAEDLHKTVTQYCAVAVKAKSSITSAWKGQLERGRHHLTLCQHRTRH